MNDLRIINNIIDDRLRSAGADASNPMPERVHKNQKDQEQEQQQAGVIGGGVPTWT
jgi:hypothetical protein